jgi:tetratricopeptide (TPR) repeat protein
VLLGVVTYPELLKRHDRLPIEDAQRIELVEFSWSQLQPFQKRLQAAYPKQGALLLRRIFHWTNGHPYLTQKLCAAVLELTDRDASENRVDELVQRLFFGTQASDDFTLQFIGNNILSSPRRRQLLRLYRRVLEGEEVPADEQSGDQNHLRLWGLLGTKDNTLTVRNEIYRHVFDLSWIKAHLGVSPKLYLAAAVGVLVLLLAGAAFFVYPQPRETAEAEPTRSESSTRSNGDEQLNILAEQFNRSGNEAEARRLFYEELSPAERLALFEPTDPREVGPQLVTVVKGVYTDPRLSSTPQREVLLQAMIQPLPLLESNSSSGLTELELELEQWLKAREYYAEGEYSQAIEALNVAIDTHDGNPATYFDRAMAHAAQGQPDPALRDLATVLTLDESWRPNVQELLTSDPDLYPTLWNDSEALEELALLVPSPTATAAVAAGTASPSPAVVASTATPSPTATVTATSTPVPPTATASSSPTPTTTPVPPTATPTASPSPAATSTAATGTPSPTTPAPTATETIPGGTFTLLSPISTAEPTYGPTDFEWEWTGPLPPDTGFEVRVWREGEFPAGVHNAVLDNQNGTVTTLDDNRYGLKADIIDAFGVRGRSGIYLWTVALVKISPEYADLGQQAEPARLRLDVPGTGGDGGDGGGGVVIN